MAPIEFWIPHADVMLKAPILKSAVLGVKSKECLTDEAKGSFGETFHLKTVVRTGVVGIYYWIEVRMESEEEHTGR